MLTTDEEKLIADEVIEVQINGTPLDRDFIRDLTKT